MDLSETEWAVLGAVEALAPRPGDVTDADRVRATAEADLNRRMQRVTFWENARTDRTRGMDREIGALRSLELIEERVGRPTPTRIDRPATVDTEPAVLTMTVAGIEALKDRSAAT